ncbi:MAG: metallophosphoesterase [Christensenella sp.]|nr:metallophosphoesterase [Christensenella sp.]
MKIFAISDLHLSKVVNKPMYIFGDSWSNYWDIIRQDWRNKVSDEDVVLVAGDVSWGLNFEEAKPDIDEIAELPGQIVICKGNHDYWWGTMKKMQSFLPENIHALHNNCLRFGDVLICGTRLWSIGPTNTDEDNKILYGHEMKRLKNSLEAMEKERKQTDTVICMLHFPPFDFTQKENDFTALFHEHGIKKVVYGHLHGDVCRADPYKKINGIEYYLTACDQVCNTLVQIL